MRGFSFACLSDFGLTRMLHRLCKIGGLETRGAGGLTQHLARGALSSACTLDAKDFKDEVRTRCSETWRVV